MATTLLITRHGTSEHNLDTRVFMGRSPRSRLVEEGRAQARRLAARLARESRPDRIVCSSLPRTAETAEIIAAALGAPPVVAEDGLWELDKGEWEGAMPRPLPAAILADIRRDPFGFRYGNGESYRDVVRRLGPVVDRHIGAHPGETLLFVLHGDVIRAMLHHLLRFPEAHIERFATDPCTLTEFRGEPEAWVLHRFNDGCHLAGP
ncbi:MAG: histidine phosphatase family protein [Candidatus Lambdaproteobacteria bacterium]|nr:histidine phosphatase family protein [Candidatus Lambdaproteobacteria bacterium]